VTTFADLPYGTIFEKELLGHDCVLMKIRPGPNLGGLAYYAVLLSTDVEDVPSDLSFFHVWAIEPLIPIHKILHDPTALVDVG
jgi:hypothetical protein